MDKKYLSDLHDDRRAAQRRLDEIVANNGSREDREKAQKRLEKVLADIGHAEGKYHGGEVHSIPPEHHGFCHLTHAERKKRLSDLHEYLGKKKEGSKEREELLKILGEMEYLHQKTTEWERIGS